MDTKTEQVDLGWLEPNEKPRSAKRKSPSKDLDDSMEIENIESSSPLEHRQRLLKELSARLVRDKQMRYAEREFEMQRLMMGKGAHKKIRGSEKVEGDDSDDDEDALDARGGRTKKRSVKSDETYKPRVYKWRVERKR